MDATYEIIKTVNRIMARSNHEIMTGNNPITAVVECLLATGYDRLELLRELNIAVRMTIDAIAETR